MNEPQQSPPPLPAKVSRGALFRWAGWFGVVNALVFSLVGIRYLLAFNWPGDLLSGVYIFLSTISQFALLATLPLFLVLLPLILVLPWRRLISGVGIVLAAAGVTLLVLDTTIFEQYRYHMSALTVAIFETSTWVLAAVTMLSVLGFQLMLAGIVWRKVLGDKQGRPGVWLAIVLIACGLISQSIHIWADATSYIPVTQFTRVLPLYFPMKAKRRLVKLGLLDEAEMERLREINAARAPESGQLKYPLSPLVCDVADRPLPNILVIMVDAMRRDQLSPELSPNILRFAADSLDFQNHYSGGNSSRMGFFSMFYGLPSTYWQTFYSSQQQPVLMEQILANNYASFLSSAVGFGSPSQIDRTVFAGVQGALSGVEGNNDAEKNTAVTTEWENWISGFNEPRPFFGFLYYDPGSSGELSGDSDSSDLSDAEQTKETYLRSLQYVDVEVGKVLDALLASGRADNTIVVLASDHGYEFDENGLGYIGHASNFSRWQLVSTLMMRWPGKNHQEFTHRTAHQDFPATLLQEVFACTNPASDYSSGVNLFSGTSWDWIVAGSYNAHAIVQPDRFVVTYPGGVIEVLGEDYRPRKGLGVDGDVTQDVMAEMRRFYK